jgi:peptidyl-prolyl cis-trans isomerase SurA
MNFIKSLFLMFVLSLIVTETNSIENKIIVKIENEIITNIDIDNETKYLSALNSDLKKLEKIQIYEISKNSIIRNKIKEIEILRNNVKPDIDTMFSDRIVQSHFSKIGLTNIKEFDEYINSFDIDIKNVKKKILIETLWNQLIFKKYSNKIKIDKEKLKKEIIQNKGKSNSFFLYEILFNISDTSKLDNKYQSIKKDIEKSNFQSAALKHSVSDTSVNGGELGWINGNSINKDILNKILKLKINQYSEPIFTPSGFLVLLVSDKKEIEKKINLDEELKISIQIQTNQQFNQYSNLYFNKIKKNINLNEL